MQLDPHKSDQSLTLIAAPFLAPRRLVITDENSESPYNFEAALEPQSGRYEITSFTFKQRENGAPVQRGEIASVRLEPFQRWARDRIHVVDSRPWAKTPTALEGDEPHPWYTYEGQPTRRVIMGELKAILDRLIDSGAKNDLEGLATLYRWYRIAEGRPTTLLAKDLDVSPATVKRYLSKAVDAGVLTDDERTR